MILSNVREDFYRDYTRKREKGQGGPTRPSSSVGKPQERPKREKANCAKAQFAPQIEYHINEYLQPQLPILESFADTRESQAENPDLIFY
jgi:hypothetical protein